MSSQTAKRIIKIVLRVSALVIVVLIGGVVFVLTVRKESTEQRNDQRRPGLYFCCRIIADMSLPVSGLRADCMGSIVSEARPSGRASQHRVSPS